MTTDDIIALLEAIADWPDPSPTAGEGGPGPLFTDGLLTQYDHDRKRHKQEIEEVIVRIKRLS